MRVLVAGATGRLGTLVVHQLVERGVAVRVLTRDRRRAAHLEDLGVEIAVGDVRRPLTLTAALEDVDVIVSSVQGFAGPGAVSPQSVDRDGNANLVAAAERARASVVLMSIVGAAPDSAMVLFRCKYAAERRLRSSSAPWTIVRSAAFIELWVDLVGKGIVFGRGENPINFVSVRDVADVVTEAVLDPGQRGQVIEVIGPGCMSFNQLADDLRQLHGRPTHVRHLPRWLLRVLSPLHRQPRAALVMDSVDLTCGSVHGGRIGATMLGEALARSGAGA
jgi:uncharacterized protein YbjT (DUF2867 family)